MTSTRRRLATLLLAACPAVVAGCTGAEVQDFFASQGHPVSADVAERIAKVATMLEQHATRDDHREHCEPTTTTTAAPTTTAVVKASMERHGDCGAAGQKPAERKH